MKDDYVEAIPYYGIAVTWAIYVMFFDLYRIHHFTFVAAWSAIVFLLLESICKRKNGENTQNESLTFRETDIEFTRNEELKQFFKEAKQTLGEIRYLKESHPKELAGDIEHIELIAVQIFKHIQTHPEKINQVRQFMT